MQKSEGEGECYYIVMGSNRNNVWFKLDRKAAGDQLLRKNSSLDKLQMDAFGGLLGTVKAQFFQQFGFDGNFEVIGFTTDRTNIKIQAMDKRTAGALKSRPGWLDQFTDNIVI